MKIIMKNRGSILQIVLVTFMILTVILTGCLSLMKFHVTNYYDINLLMQQKNIEIMSVYHFVYQMKNDILLSDEYIDEDYEVYYYVDDFGSYLEMKTSIISKKMNYSFITQIDKSTYCVLKFEYEE